MDAPPPPPKRRKKGAIPPWVVIAVLVVLFGGAGGAYFYLSRPKSGVSDAQIDADARANLVVGMPKDDAKRWLEGKGYAVGPLLDGAAKENGHQTRVRNDTRLNEVEIEIKFWYDGDGKVTLVAVSKIKATK